jgi:hypothetical protein
LEFVIIWNGGDALDILGYDLHCCCWVNPTWYGSERIIENGIAPDICIVIVTSFIVVVLKLSPSVHDVARKVWSVGWIHWWIINIDQARWVCSNHTLSGLSLYPTLFVNPRSSTRGMVMLGCLHGSFFRYVAMKGHS